MNNADKLNILQLIKEKKISPQQGAAIFKALGKSGTGQNSAPKQQCMIGKKFADGMNIAVIGMSGRFPKADNVGEFWERLKNGDDCTDVVPKCRWDIDKVYSADPKVPNKTVSKWLGELNDVDKFDPLFFNISFKEAESTDPQHRLFLQEAWHALEDANCPAEYLSGKKCGVFVGALGGDYMQVVKASGKALDSLFLTGSSNAFLAARIAYFLNLKGPTLSLDTACSSSLVAIHLACESILSGDSEIAVAGGVSIVNTPDMHIATSKAGILSPTGKCRSFDNRADGIVIGEAVGAIVLKPLVKALEDNDYIYGVIKGSAVNEDGRTNGITAPSADSQSELESYVYNKYHINPARISYVEAHGTGTKLGDPIEVSALTKSFREFTKKKQYCAIGSVKSNVGHCLAASGVVGVIKLLLCMKYHKLVPSVNYETENEHIHFSESPFYVNTAVKDWNSDDGEPLEGAISSLGLSGTNCHIVIEEAPHRSFVQKDLPRYFLPLSAKTGVALRQKVLQMIDWMGKDGRSSSIGEISRALNAKTMFKNCRLAFVVKDKNELMSKLTALARLEDELETVSDREKVDEDEKAAASRLTQSLSEMLTDEQYAQGLEKLADLFKRGCRVDLRHIYSEFEFANLPGYPFAKEKIWVSGSEKTEGKNAVLHPLIDANVSTLEEQCFKKTLTKDDFCMNDHIVNGRMVLPGVAYMEMVLNAVNMSLKNEKVKKLKNLVWTKPLTMNGNHSEVYVALYPQTDGAVAFEVRSVDENGAVTVNSTGKAEYSDKNNGFENDEFIDIQKIMDRCGSQRSGEEFYKVFYKLGLQLKAGFRSVKMIYGGVREAIARIELPEGLEKDFSKYVLHPSIMDGSLQTTGGTTIGESESEQRLYLPFGLDEMEIVHKTRNVCYSYATVSEIAGSVKKFNVSVMDENGRVLIKFKNFCGREITGSADLSQKRSEDNHISSNQSKSVYDLLHKLENGEIGITDAEELLSLQC